MKQENEWYWKMNKVCTECGHVINIKAEICPKCGVRQAPIAENNFNNPAPAPSKENKWLITLLLCWFLGVFGAHRFYLGHTGTGILMLLTFGFCGIWTLIDFIVIAVGNFRDAEGNIIKNG